MKVAVLIGFSYGEDNESPHVDPDRNPLPGIVVDLYQAYVASRSMDAQKIIVITDIVKDQQTSVLMNAMIDSIVDSNILTFIETIRNNEVYHHFSGREDFLGCINDIISGATEVFLYYTGHVNRGYLLFPFLFPPFEGRNEREKEDSGVSFVQSNHQVTMVANQGNPTETMNYTVDGADHSQLKPLQISMSHKSANESPKLLLIELRTLILSSVDKYAEVFLVMDCCNGNGLGLPFHLRSRIYRLTNSEPRIYTTQKVICLSSTMSDENSVTSRDGSIFTRSLFKQMRDHEQSIHRLLKVVGKECLTKYSQTATVHASYPDLKILWNWVYGKVTISIIINYTSNTLSIDLNGSRRSKPYPNKKLNICIIRKDQILDPD